MLLVFMYHRIGVGKHANSYSMLKEHLTYLKDRYTIILPGDPIPSKKLSICLTFDDATFDFYHYVYPLLAELNIRALLGVPVRYIMEKTLLAPEERLSVPYPMMMQDGIFDGKMPFCTWSELHEMVKSGHVEVASHSFSHPNLTFPFANLQNEVVNSKKILEERLPQAVSSFIYPFGKTNESVHSCVREHYAYAFRIGSALNRKWMNEKPHCRVPADCLKSAQAPLSPLKLLSYFGKWLLDD